MKVKEVSYASTGFFSNTVLDYLRGEAALRPFYSYLPEAASVPAVIDNVRQHYRFDRSRLAAAIREGYEDIEMHPRAAAHVDLLEKDNSYTITTAHQLNLFLGPLYLVYKILNTIRVAQDLGRQFPGQVFLPCFWMGSEDHDFEEVNHIRCYDREISWDRYQGGSLGTYDTGGIPELIPELQGILRDGEFLDRLTDIFRRAYSRPRLSKAVTACLNEIFGHYGLVVVDGSLPALKQCLKGIIRDELTEQSSHRIVSGEIESLAAAGYGSQATPREINLFYADDRQRERIVPADEGYRLADSGTEFSGEALMALADTHPEKFSPNVILRPLHQQSVLPNAAYIGGGSELAYWMQLQGLFKYHGIHFPMLLLRTSAMIIPERSWDRLEDLGIPQEEVFRSTDALKKLYVKGHSSHDLELTGEINEVASVFRRLQELSGKIDGSLHDWIGAEGKKAQKSLENISKRFIRSEKNNHEQSMSRIEQIRAQLFPSGILQERRENFSRFYARRGPAWLDSMLEVLDPFAARFYVLKD